MAQFDYANATAQSIFDFVATHLFTQGKRSINNTEDRCLLHGPDGCKCAAGCLIPPGIIFDEEWEHIDPKDALATALECAGLGNSPLMNHLELVSQLQSDHDDEDNWRTPQHLREALRETAFQFDLSAYILATLPDFPTSKPA